MKTFICEEFGVDMPHVKNAIAVVNANNKKEARELLNSEFDRRNFGRSKTIRFEFIEIQTSLPSVSVLKSAIL